MTPAELAARRGLAGHGNSAGVGMSDVDFTPQPGSFLWAVAQAAPNDVVQVASVRGTAGAVARDVRQMLDEIERLRRKVDKWQGMAEKLADQQWRDEVEQRAEFRAAGQ